MYVPAAFQGPEQEQLFDFIEAHSFAVLFSQVDGQPFASHVPLLLRKDDPHGTLIGHFARANPHWRELAGQQVLAVFPGPHAYVSPTWYEAENVVPTWNYVAVHATGRCVIIDDEESAAQILADFVARYERPMPQPWSIDMDGSFADKLVRQIVAFEIQITRLEGKWKLGQNQPVERRERVALRLESSLNPQAQAIGMLMRETLAR